MNIKLLVQLLASLAFYQVHGAAGEGAKPRDMFDTAWALHHDLDTAVNNVAEQVIPELNLLSDEMNAKATATVASAKAEVEILHSQILSEVDDLRNENVDPDQLEACISRYLPQISQMDIYVVDEITRCLNSNVKEAVAVIELSLNSTQVCQKVVISLGLEIQECELEPEDVNCVIDVIQQISIETVNLPATIQEDANKAKATVKVLEEALLPCANDRIDVVPTIGEQIIGYMKLCAGIPVKSRVSK